MTSTVMPNFDGKYWDQFTTIEGIEPKDKQDSNKRIKNEDDWAQLSVVAARDSHAILCNGDCFCCFNSNEC